MQYADVEKQGAPQPLAMAVDGSVPEVIVVDGTTYVQLDQIRRRSRRHRCLFVALVAVLFCFTIGAHHHRRHGHHGHMEADDSHHHGHHGHKGHKGHGHGRPDAGDDDMHMDCSLPNDPELDGTQLQLDAMNEIVIFEGEVAPTKDQNDEEEDEEELQALKRGKKGGKGKRGGNQGGRQGGRGKKGGKGIKKLLKASAERRAKKCAKMSEKTGPKAKEGQSEEVAAARQAVFDATKALACSDSDLQGLKELAKAHREAIKAYKKVKKAEREAANEEE